MSKTARMPKPPRATTRASRTPVTALSGPGSLVHPEARRGVLCRSCGSNRVTEIGMTLTDGSQVRFACCHVCEQRAWVEGDQTLPFDRVLDKTRKIA